MSISPTGNMTVVFSQEVIIPPILVEAMSLNKTRTLRRSNYFDIKDVVQITLNLKSESVTGKSIEVTDYYVTDLT